MRWCVSVGAVLVAGMIVGGDVAGIAAPSPKSRSADTADNVSSVNVELVIAVDVSYSMDMDELAIQREGYAQAIVSKDFLQALVGCSGQQGGRDLFRVVDVGRREDHHSLARDRRPYSNGGCRGRRDHETPVRRGSSTPRRRDQFHRSCSKKNPYRGSRRVIDISGDGPNNDGAPVTMRDAAPEKGIIINGSIMVKEPSLSTTDIENLDLYYEDCVIGGPGAHRRRSKIAKIPGRSTKLVLGKLRASRQRADRPSRRERAPGALSDRRKKSQERGRR